MLAAGSRHHMVDPPRLFLTLKAAGVLLIGLGVGGTLMAVLELLGWGAEVVRAAGGASELGVVDLVSYLFGVVADHASSLAALGGGLYLLSDGHALAARLRRKPR
jgi:hypothetical protein